MGKQESVEYCRLADLPDFNNDRNSWLRSELISWVRWIIKEDDFYAIRIDTVTHMGHGFLKDFTASAAVYSVGECFNNDVGMCLGI